MEEMAYCSSLHGLRRNGSDRWLTTDDDGKVSVCPSHGSQSAVHNDFGEKVSDNEDASGSERSEEFEWQQTRRSRDVMKERNERIRKRKWQRRGMQDSVSKAYNALTFHSASQEISSCCQLIRRRN
jgi:hypothetical protein